MLGAFLDFQTVSFNDDVRVMPLRAVVDELRLWPTTADAELHAHAADASVLFSNKVKLERALLEALPDLKLICLAATGTNNVDLQAARERGVAVCNVVSYCTAAVAQHVFAFILSLNQHLDEYGELLAGGAWKRAPQFTLLDYPIRELTGRVMGIVGYGELGSAVAKFAEAFGMRVLIATRNADDTRPERIPLAELLSQSDVVSLHCPLTPETRGLIGRQQLALMKPDAILINTARGALVDEQALADALRGGAIGGAGIDVLSEEPPVHGNPLLEPGIPNLIVTPHIAWATREARQRVIVEMAANVAAFKKGEKRNRVV
ncbi:MAG TPA: NAD(P)-dependent oxidoreductase [Gammaproteobacteria bacterium]